MTTSLKSINSLIKRGYTISDESREAINDIKKEERHEEAMSSIKDVIKENSVALNKISSGVEKLNEKKKFVFHVKRDSDDKIEKVLAEEI